MHDKKETSATVQSTTSGHNRQSVPKRKWCTDDTECHGVRVHFATPLVVECDDRAYKRSAYEHDLSMPDRGSVIDVIEAERARSGFTSVSNDDVLELLKAQHLRCASCGVPFKLRRFADDDTDQHRISKIVDHNDKNIGNAVLLCVTCDGLGAGLAAVRAEVGSGWNLWDVRNVMIDAPIAPTCSQPVVDVFDEICSTLAIEDDVGDYVQRLVLEREPMHDEPHYDDVRD